MLQLCSPRWRWLLLQQLDKLGCRYNSCADGTAARCPDKGCKQACHISLSPLASNCAHAVSASCPLRTTQLMATRASCSCASLLDPHAAARCRQRVIASQAASRCCMCTYADRGEGRFPLGGATSLCRAASLGARRLPAPSTTLRGRAQKQRSCVYSPLHMHNGGEQEQGLPITVKRNSSTLLNTSGVAN